MAARNDMATKIYGTIGPACSDTGMLVRLFEKGMTGIRINLSHANLADAAEWIANIHAAWEQTRGYAAGRKKTNREEMPDAVEILMDLRGPELRIGRLLAERDFTEGDMLTLVPDGKNNLFDPTEIPAPKQIFSYLQSGQELLLDDGKIKLVVEELCSNVSTHAAETEASDRNNIMAECRVLCGGVLKSEKSIALPGKCVDMPTLTESDLSNIAAAKEYGITGVMLPFVRGREDLLCLREALQRAGQEEVRIFAKIESMDGVKKLPELLPYADEIVIARGDLGNAMPLWKLPVVQAQIAGMCREKGKPFMVVTQMLASMEKAAVPTRAEVSDIFHAVRQGAASVMLTGETAAGRYPEEAMMYMVNTVREAESIAECQ